MKGRALGPPRAVHWVLTPTSYQPSSAKGSCRLSLRTGSLEVEPEARLVGVQVVGWKCPQETPERGRGKQEVRRSYTEALIPLHLALAVVAQGPV